MGIAGDYIRPFKNIAQNKHFRTWLRLYYRLKSKPEKTSGVALFEGYKMTYADAMSFIFQYKEIFVHEYYRFATQKKNPVIIDCGANIGMCCLYFKKLFPSSKILAFEADPQIATLLDRNIKNNHLEDVHVFQKAIWTDNEGMTFYADGADGGSFYGSGNTKNNVPTLRLKELLLQQEHVDFLKIDIEGAETAVIKDCDEALQRVDNLYVEYHSIAGQQQELGALLSKLEKNGFRYVISSLYKQPHPLINPAVNNEMDLQLHIFAGRRG